MQNWREPHVVYESGLGVQRGGEHKGVVGVLVAGVRVWGVLGRMLRGRQLQQLRHIALLVAAVAREELEAVAVVGQVRRRYHHRPVVLIACAHARLLLSGPWSFRCFPALPCVFMQA